MKGMESIGTIGQRKLYSETVSSYGRNGVRRRKKNSKRQSEGNDRRARARKRPDA